MYAHSSRFVHPWIRIAVAGVAVALIAGCSSSKPANKSTSGGAGGNGTTLNTSGSSSGNTGQLAPASSSSGTNASTDTNVASLPSELDRKIVRTATLTLRADNVAERFQDASSIATQLGGFVSNSTFGNTGSKQTASITIRVPGERYQDALVQLRKLGDVRDENSNANDATEEYTDLGSRLRNLQATETQYLGFLKNAGNLSDVLTVQDRLSQTRGQIEQVQGRINLLDSQTNFATITVHLEPGAIANGDQGGGTGPLQTARRAFDASLVVLLGLSTAILAVGAFSWWLLPLGVGGWVLARKSLRASRERRAPPA